MARVYGIQGNVTGKIANTIYAVVKGVNVARAYNPEPANPSTPGQIESRAKLKVLSQLAKQLSPIIAFRSVGLVSARNQFIKANYESAAFSNDVASIEMSDVDLTGGLVSLGQLSASISDNQLSGVVVDAAANVRTVVFGTVAVRGNGSIHVFDPQVVEYDPANPSRFTMSPIDVGGFDNINVFAYGVRYNDLNEYAKYAQLAVSAAGSASLNVIRRLDPSSTTITETLHVSVQNA